MLKQGYGSIVESGFHKLRYRFPSKTELFDSSATLHDEKEHDGWCGTARRI